MNGSGMALSERTTARIIGVLFIVGTVSGVLSWPVLGPLTGASDYLARIAAHPVQMALGAMLVLIMGFSLSLVPVVFYPVAKRHSEILAMGYLVFRGALEGCTYIVNALGLLLLMALSAQSSAAVLSIADAVKLGVDVLTGQMIAIPFSLGALMFGYLLYASRLVPRWLSIWGLVGAALYLGAPLMRTFGMPADYLMGPLALQEMVLAVWLIARGFTPSVVAVAKRSATLPKAATA